VDVSLVIKRRLKELGLEQRDLASAAQVTESYISQLLARKKAPPAPARTDIYDRIERFLRLPGGELSRLADLQRKEELKQRLADPPEPLFKAFRALVLRKCESGKQLQIRETFEKEPFGSLERLVTQKLLDVAKRVVKEELERSGSGHERTRVANLEFLQTDVFHISAENCVSILDPLIEEWDIDLETFAIEIILNRSLGLRDMKRFDFVEREPERPFEIEPGLVEFLQDPQLSGDATDEEIEFLKSLRFKDRRPLPLYYYRILQTTRDPLHFRMEAEPNEGS